MQLRTDVLNAEKREGYQTSKLTKYTGGGGVVGVVVAITAAFSARSSSILDSSDDTLY